MKLGAFSISLSVKDIHASRQFYENLGFSVFGGNIDQKWLIMKTEMPLSACSRECLKNIITFNPGWDENAQNMDDFDDVRAIQKQLKEKGIKLESEAAENTSGPASIGLTDPDGNSILVDQHR